MDSPKTRNRSLAESETEAAEKMINDQARQITILTGRMDRASKTVGELLRKVDSLETIIDDLKG